jgi:hypothetical protein
MFATIVSWMALRARTQRAKEIEILVLRHQLAVLQRCTPRPSMRWIDRAGIAALPRLLPPHRRRRLLVSPSTILRWHRQLATRRWITRHARPARPAIPAGVRALILPLANENPTEATGASIANSPDLAARSARSSSTSCRRSGRAQLSGMRSMRRPVVLVQASI